MAAEYLRRQPLPIANKKGDRMASDYRIYELTGLTLDLADHLSNELVKELLQKATLLSNAELDAIIMDLRDLKRVYYNEKD